MKKKNYIKFNKFIALSLVFVMIFCTNSFADNYIYSPGAKFDSSTSSPLNDPALNPTNLNTANTKVTNEEAAKIKQIVISNSTNQTNVAESVTAPTAAAVTNNNVTSALSPAQAAALANIAAASGQSVSNVQIGGNAGTATTFSKFTASTSKAPAVSAPAYILVNANTGHIYTSKDMDKRYEPAGLANLMTAYIATQKFKMDQVLVVNATAVRGVDKDAAIAALDVGDTITLKDALASMFVKGCVDSANVVAENVSGSIDEFVKLMNSTAKTLGLQNEYFVNPSGISNEGQQTSAYDMAILMAKVCENPELVELLSLSQYTLPKAKRRDKLTLYSKNTQLSKTNSTYNPDVTCSRMGYNSKAKYCIASMMNYKNNHIIVVLLKAAGSQFSDTKKLLEFGKICCEEDIHQ